MAQRFDLARPLLSTKGGKVLIRDERWQHTVRDITWNKTANLHTVRWQCTDRLCKASAITRRAQKDGIDSEPVWKGVHVCAQTCNATINDKARQHYLWLVSAGVAKPLAYDNTWDDLANPNIVPAAYINTLGREAFSTQESYKSAANRITKTVHPPLPQDIDELNIMSPVNYRYRRTKDGKRRFFLFDCATDGKRMWCFATTAKLKLLEENTRWQGDGTWSVVPKLINKRKGQLFTLHTWVHGICVPCVYVFLPGKKQLIYADFFAHLKEAAARLGITLNCSRFMTDFESGLMPAIRNAFPNVQLDGCYFHFCQAVYRKVQKNPTLLQWYREEEHFQLFIRSILALAYLKPDDVIRTYNNICRGYGHLYPAFMSNEAVIAFLSYFEEQWFVSVKVEHWNVFALDRHRTNNAVEGWHNRLLQKMGYHPTIWNAIVALQAEEHYYDRYVLQAEVGLNVLPRKKVYITLDNQIRRMKYKYNAFDYTPVQFIKYLVRILHKPKWDVHPDSDDENSDDEE